MLSVRFRARTSLAGGLVLLLFASACAQLETLTTEEALERLGISSSKVYAADGTLIANLHGEINRDIVSLEDIPKHVQDAVIAIEDRRYWNHRGIDLRAITRAAMRNVGAAGEDEGSLQGGSTLSQQLVKNLYFPEPSRTVERKLAEARITMQFEQQYEKEEILEMYLNTVYFGRGVYGIQTAAQSYFRKDARDLQVEEAAFLAGVIHEPGRYEWSDQDAAERKDARRASAEARRNLVLRQMAQNGFLTPEAQAEAAERPLEVHPPTETQWQHPYFVDMLLRELGVLRNGELDGRYAFLGDTTQERGEVVYRGGLRIYTTLDPRSQEAAEEAVRDVLPEQLDKLSTSLVSVEPGTGNVRAAVGGRNYYPVGCPEGVGVEDQSHECRLGKVNLALGEAGGGSGRQPGSAFKPFVLAAALVEGVGLNWTFDGSPFKHRLPAGEWSVSNYEGSAGGRMSLIEATVRSVNAAFARLLIQGLGDGDALDGSTKVAQLARRMGVSFPTPAEVREHCGDRYGQTGACTAADHVPAISLGAKEVSPLEMAAAYATFANAGVWARPTTVVRIEDSSGRVLYEAEPETRRAMPADVAHAVSYVLQQAVQRGTGTRARIDRPVAGKTGTSQMWRDAWFAGYVPQLTTVVWVGNPIPLPGSGLESMVPRNGYPLRVVGGSYPSMIWRSYMTTALEGVPVERFASPSSRHLSGTKQRDRSEELEDLEALEDEELEELEAVPGEDEPPTEGAARRGTRATVPNVIGMAEASARNALSQAGYSSASVRECGPSGGGLRVWRQSPGGGSSAPQGSTVTIWVNPAVCRD